MIAVLGMYPFAHLRDSYDQLWQSVASHLVDAPDRLDRAVDLHESWRRDDLLLGQTCGWPLVTSLPELAVVGAFDVVAPFAAAGRYRSVLVGVRPQSPAELASTPDSVVAMNSDTSLSGWISLCAALGRRPQRVLTTGSHGESVRAVSEGRAHLASIDALSFEFLMEAERPMVSRLHIVGHGPLVPSLPLVTSFTHRLDELRQAVAVAVTETTAVCTRLRIRGFVPFDRSDYESLTELMPPPVG